MNIDRLRKSNSTNNETPSPLRLEQTVSDNKGKIIAFIAIIAFLLLYSFAQNKLFPGMVGNDEQPVLSYSDAKNWVYKNQNPNAAFDVFFICPDSAVGKEGVFNINPYDYDASADFKYLINWSSKLFSETGNLYAPYYRQCTLAARDDKGNYNEEASNLAYSDVKNAFNYYLDTFNNGRPFVIAGFAQGSNHAVQLIKDCLSNPEIASRMVAAYVPGCRVTEDDVAAYPWLKPAQSSDDIGVFICYNAEAPDVSESVIVPAGTKSFVINPLNWRTDTEIVGREFNKGAVFTDHHGRITSEIPNFTGAYIDEERGVLKITDVNPEDYKSDYPSGVYHMYDIQFFYENLKQNVEERYKSWLEASK